MGLIKCPDCGKEFSDRIESCPKCSCPTSEALKELKKEEQKSTKTSVEKEVIKDKKSDNVKRKDFIEYLSDINYDENKFMADDVYSVNICIIMLKKMKYIKDKLKDISLEDSDSPITDKQKEFYKICIKSNDDMKVVKYIIIAYNSISDFIKNCEQKQLNFSKQEKEKLLEMIEYLSTFIQGFIRMNEETISLLNAESKTDKLLNNFYIDKNELMSSKELKKFAFENVYPIIEKELGGKITEIVKTNQSKHEVYCYLVIDENEVIGLDLFVEVAPSKSSFIYNEEHAKNMKNIGYKYAVAQVGVGATDPIKFERRRVFKNDEFYFNYEKLKFFDYNEISNTKICYSLSENSNSVNFIYEREKENINSYLVEKKVPSFMKDYMDKDYNLSFVNISKSYDIPDEYILFYSKYIYKLAGALNYRLEIKTLFYTFLNCVDYCKGIFLSDSKEISKKDIISEVHKLLDDNKLIDLTEYDKYTFAFYIYYYLTKGETSCELNSIDEMNKLKIELFEKKPDYFEFNSLVNKRNEEKKINSYENIYNMLQSGIEFMNNNYSQYININIEMNSAGIKTPIDFSKINTSLEELLSDARNKLKFLQNGFDISKPFPKKDIYSTYRKTLNEYIGLLELDCSMNYKLNNKAKGGKYGFFEYKKDSKIRNQKCHEIMALIERLSNIFIVKELSKNTNIMIDTCKYLVYDLWDQYIDQVKGDSSKYKTFREKLCTFYDETLAMPYDKDATDFRQGVLFAITDFIELIELNEKTEVDESKIEDFEEELLKNLEIIKDKIFKIQV